MNELSTINEYGKFKEALGTELRNQAEGFVRTGYLLKVARDTDILKESGYSTVAEFAQAEYGLPKDMVSRYIAINDRYSMEGYSEYLQEQFEGYGIAKLQEMLTLPDTVVDMIHPEMTKREIRDIKDEIKEEKQISDMEVYLEGDAPDQENMTTLQKAIHKYFYEQREQYIKLEKVIRAELSFDEAVEQLLDVIAPSGIALKTVRVQGLGKLMISFKGKENDIEILNVRSNEKQLVTWQQFIENMASTFGKKASVDEWENTYKESFKAEEAPKEEKKAEVAPAQQKVVQIPIKTESKSKLEKPKIQTINKEEDEEEDIVDNSSESSSESEESEESEEEIDETEEDKIEEEQEMTESKETFDANEEEVEEKTEEPLEDITDHEKERKIAEAKKQIEKEIESIKTQVSFNRFENALAASAKLLTSLQDIISLEEE